MAATILETLGTVKPDGTLTLDQKVTVPPGRVKVRVESVELPKPTTESLVEFIERTRREMAAAGSHFMNDEEVTSWIEELRADDDRIEQAYQQMAAEPPERDVAAMLIYFDSVIVIYLIDHTGTFQTRAAKRLADSIMTGDQIAVSDLTRLECRVKPIALGDKIKLAGFDAFFARPDVQHASLSTVVYDRATFLRAMLNLKLGDSLHLAAAIEAGCDRFLTNDHRLSKCTDITVEVLP